MTRKTAVVLGAGPAGLTAAWKLAEKGYQVEVVERDTQVGGMAKTLQKGRIRADYGPHTFHVRDTEESRSMVAAVKSLLKEEPHELQRGTRIFLRGKYYEYPLRLQEVLLGVGPGLALRILADYAAANLRYLFSPPRGHSSFEEWGVKMLGRTLYDLCFGIYSRKVWGIPTSQLSSKQAQRVAKLSLKNLVLRMFGVKADPVVYFQKYLYPIGGIGNLYQEMRRRVEGCNGNVHLGARIEAIATASGRVSGVRIQTPQGPRHLACDLVVSTLPLPVIAELFSPALDPGLRELAKGLRYRSLRLVYVVVNRPSVTDYHWCYLLEDRFRCNRFSEQKNVAPEMLPKGQTVLCFEISCFSGDEVWSATDEELLRIVQGDLDQLGLVKREEIADCFTGALERAYPVYDLGFEERIMGTLKGLSRFENLLMIGRHGLYMNNSMDDNVLLGINVAEFIDRRGALSREWLEEAKKYMVLRYEGK